jgi:hypothetical protein
MNHKSRAVTPRPSNPPSRRNTGLNLFHKRPSFAPYDPIENPRSTLAVPNEIFFHDVSSRLNNHSKDENNHTEHERHEYSDEEDGDEVVWVRRESQKRKHQQKSQPETVPLRNMSLCRSGNEENCKKLQALADRKKVVVEWQSIATVVDRILFWIFLLGTAVAYLVILVLVPNTKPDFRDGDTRTRVLYKIVS